MKNEKMLRFLYHTLPGRLMLRVLIAPGLSRAAGKFLSSAPSKLLVPGFVRRAEIDLSQCEKQKFSSFNDCFTRKLYPSLRPFAMDKDALCAPCDGLLSVYPIQNGTVFPVKQSAYTLDSLLREHTVGYAHAFVFRLCVTHYHRYAYPAEGLKSAQRDIPGVLHTVRPIALEGIPVFCENARSFCTIDNPAFGRLLQMEVGALLVGKIQNHIQGEAEVKKGEEKGMFLYGGSTVILLTPPNVIPLPEFLTSGEHPVQMGQRINA